MDDISTFAPACTCIHTMQVVCTYVAAVIKQCNMYVLASAWWGISTSIPNVSSMLLNSYATHIHQPLVTVYAHIFSNVIQEVSCSPCMYQENLVFSSNKLSNCFSMYGSIQCMIMYSTLLISSECM